MAERELNILVKAKGAVQAARDIGKVDSATGKLGKNVGKLGRAAAIGIGAAVGVGAAIVGRSVKAGLDSLALLEDATTQVGGAITSRGEDFLGISPTQVASWANEIEASIGAAFDDKDITSATANLIRFGKVGKDNLKPAMVVMTDLAAKTGSVESASALLGKALADPTKAAGKLSRVGVILTEQQQKQIKAFMKAGDVAKAQGVILDSLAETTKGAAEATQGPYRRSLSVLADVTEDAQRALAEGFLPVIEKVRDILTKELAKPETIQRIREFGQGLAKGLDGLIEMARGIPWGTIGDSLRIAGTGAKAVFDAFVGLPPWIQGAVLTGWGLNKLTGGALGGVVGELGKGLIKGVLGMNAGVVNIKAGVVNGAGGAGGGGLGAVGSAVAGAGVAGAGIMAANDLSVMAGAVSKGYQAVQQGDMKSLLQAQRDVLTGVWAIPAPIRELGTAVLDQLAPKIGNQIAAPVRVLTDHQDQMRRDTMTKLASVRDRAEANRIATVTKGDAIVRAIHSIKFVANVTVPLTINAAHRRAVAHASTGGTLGRAATSGGGSHGGTSGPQE